MFRRLFSSLSHVNSDGKAQMVDVIKKSPSIRTAKACSLIYFRRDVFNAVKNNTLQKGDVLTVAKLAGINAAKQCSNLVPLCHPLKITNVDLDYSLNETDSTLTVTSSVSAFDFTGVEVEALMAASVCAVTIFDMTKSISKNTVISQTYLLEKTGGKSGDYKAKQA